jgi:DNA-binding transcriptional MocR family regulator
VRIAAWDLGCAPGTVAKAYAALRAEGLVHARVGSGTYAGAEGEAPTLLSAPAPLDGAEIDLSKNLFALVPPPVDLAEALHTAAERPVPERALHVDEAGCREDREACLPFVRRWRPTAELDELVFTNGAQSAISSAIAGLTPAGATIVCDALTYPGLITIAQVLGRRLLPLPMDADGMQPEALKAALDRRSVAAAFLMPSVHNPTGICMPAERREQLAAVARKSGTLILEDEVYGFAVEGSFPSFSQLLPEQTVLISSLTKWITYSLRVGFVAAPPVLARRIATTHANLQMMVSPLLTGAAAHVLRHGDLDAHARRLRAALQERSTLLRAAFPGLTATATRSGLAWVPMANQWSSEAFTEEARALGVRVFPTRIFAPQVRQAPEGVRVSLAVEPDSHRFELAARRLSWLLGTTPVCEAHA